MLQLIMLKGLPWSGKSFWAKEQVKSWWFKRVSKDDLREMIDWWRRSKRNEKTILSTRDHIIYTSLMNGTGIIVDDTNFAPYHEEQLRKLADECWAKFVIKEFDTPLETCIERDSKREKPVWRKVIEEMYNKYLNKEWKEKPYRDWLKECIIVDIDGTLAFKWDRNIYDDSKLHLDTVNDKIREILHLYKNNYNNVDIIICSWRMDTCKEQTEKWLQDNRVPYDYIYMRKWWDVRRDSIIKEEIYREHIEPYYNVKFIFDDRPVVVWTRRNMWLYVFDCNQPWMDF